MEKMNVWLLPILTVTILGMGGAVAEKVWGNNTLLATVNTNQKIVMAAQDSMKHEIREIRQTQAEVKEALHKHNEEARVTTTRITTLHHQRGIKNCDICHDRKGKLIGPPDPH